MSRAVRSLALVLALLASVGCDDDMLEVREICPLVPVPANAAGVVPPERIESSVVAPTYPEPARVARVEGNVIVQAVISTEGDVCRTTVLSVDAEGWGFEAASAEAVGRWRYEPATSGGGPIAVGLTISVQFRLNR